MPPIEKQIKANSPRSKLASTPWTVGALLIVSAVILPIIFIFSEMAKPTTDSWTQLTEYDADKLLEPEFIELLPPKLQAKYTPQPPNLWERTIDTLSYQDFHRTILYKRLLYTIIILASVACLTLIIGVSLAWLVTSRTFPGQKFLAFSLALPIAIPTYVAATSYKLMTAEFQLAMSIQVRKDFGAETMQSLNHGWNLALAILVLTITFYPYVFLAARSSFLSLSKDYLETSQSLGKSHFFIFRKITLPLARPAIIGGLMLVCLETMNEYGAMKIIGIETLMTEIFRIRSGTNDLNTVLRISGCILSIVFILLVIELLLRGRKKFHPSRSATLSDAAPKASNKATFMIYSATLPAIILGFILPCSELLRQAFHGLKRADISDFIGPIGSSASLAAQASLLTLMLGIFLAFAQRIVSKSGALSTTIMKLISKASSLGYAIPGAVLGVALMTWVGSLLQSSHTNSLIETIFYSSSYGLIIAYSIRFLSIGINAAESGFANIPMRLDEASAQLGKSSFTTFIRIHLPLLKPSLLAGALILFLDVLKELPLTLIIQPFNTETLALQTFTLFSSQEEYALGSIPALILIFTGVIGMIAVRKILNQKPHRS